MAVGNQVHWWRKVKDRAVTVLMLAFTALALLPLAHLLLYVTAQGAPVLGPEFLTGTPKPVGEPGGGMGNAIVGSAILVGLACVIGLPMGVLGGVYLAEYGTGRYAGLIRFLTDVLNGVPSIVTGIFVYTFIVLAMGRFSAIAGGVALGVIMIPLVVRTT
ncbi:MAG: phosphate ABC transporter permease PtsA, partial [Clostridia bacterium]|nr:phosphate ABC transporter permease PtsA [Clostridia bacterium]